MHYTQLDPAPARSNMPCASHRGLEMAVASAATHWGVPDPRAYLPPLASDVAATSALGLPSRLAAHAVAPAHPGRLPAAAATANGQRPRRDGHIEHSHGRMWGYLF